MGVINYDYMERCKSHNGRVLLRRGSFPMSMEPLCC